MIFLSGVYYPTAQLPHCLQMTTRILPLNAAVILVRPLVLGRWPAAPLIDVALLLGYAVLGFYVATVLTRRRLLK